MTFSFGKSLGLNGCLFRAHLQASGVLCLLATYDLIACMNLILFFCVSAIFETLAPDIPFYSFAAPLSAVMNEF